jgi:Kef-type K+ transport system membrane component KefB
MADRAVILLLIVHMLQKAVVMAVVGKQAQEPRQADQAVEVLVRQVEAEVIILQAVQIKVLQAQILRVLVIMVIVEDPAQVTGLIILVEEAEPVVQVEPEPPMMTELQVEVVWE